MIAQDVLELFQTIVDDDEISEVQSLIMMNNAEMIVEDMRDWVVLRKKDKTLTHSASDTYLTPHTLPTDFKQVRQDKVFVQFADGSTKQIHPIAFDDIEAEKDSYGYFAIDYSTTSPKIYLTGTYSQSVTIVLNYIKRSSTITALADILIWPGTYGSILAYQMAKIYSGGIDGDDTNFRMSPYQLAEFKSLYSAMCMWDGKLQLADMDGQVGINPRAK